MSGHGRGDGGEEPCEHAIHGERANAVGMLGAREYEERLAHHAGKQGTRARYVGVRKNGCTAYDGCDPGYPVVFCSHPGGHTVPSFAPWAIWEFFGHGP